MRHSELSSMVKVRGRDILEMFVLAMTSAMEKEVVWRKFVLLLMLMLEQVVLMQLTAQLVSTVIGLNACLGIMLGRFVFTITNALMNQNVIQALMV
jgi:hypothetical protein